MRQHQNWFERAFTRGLEFDDSDLFEEPQEPEKYLLQEIITQAWKDLFPAETDPMFRRIEARRWLTSRSSHPWSFEWICDRLEISEAFRHRIRCEAMQPLRRGHTRIDGKGQYRLNGAHRRAM